METSKQLRTTFEGHLCYPGLMALAWCVVISNFEVYVLICEPFIHPHEDEF